MSESNRYFITKCELSLQNVWLYRSLKFGALPQQNQASLIMKRV